MAINILKLLGAAAVVLISGGAWPHARYGGVIAVGVCIMGAVALHFVAP